MARRHDGAPQDQDQRQIQPARGDRVSSSCRPESSRGQPIWPVGQVPGVSSELGVCAVQQRDSKNPSIKNKTEVVHVAKAAAVPSVKVKNPKAMATGGVSNKELETALEKQAGYVVSGIAEALQPLAVNMAQQQQSMHEALSLMRQQVNMVAASSSSGLPMQQQQMQMPVLPPAMFSNPQQHAIHSDQEMNPNESWEVQP